MEVSVRGTPVRITTAVVVFALIALALVGHGGYEYVQQSESVADAVDVEATVVETSITTVESGRRGIQYDARVVFTYQFQGTEYTSDQLFPGSFDATYDTRSAAESAISGYDEGTTVTAFVDPDAPAQGFLEPRTSRGPVEFVAIGVVVLLVTCLDAIGARKPGHGTELRSVDGQGSKRYRQLAGVDRKTVHRVSTRLIAMAAVAIPAALVGVGFLLLSSGSGSGAEPVRLTVGLTDPAGLLLGVAGLSILVLLASLMLYTVWSVTEYRRLRDRIPEPRPPSPFKRPTRLVTVLVGNYDLDAYGRRVRRTGFALLVTGVLGGGILYLLVL